MTSVKGLTWGSPEFVRIAKSAELEGESRHEADQLLDELESMEMSVETFYHAKYRACDIFELCGGECQWR
jgi:hypothetical protein